MRLVNVLALLGLLVLAACGPAATPTEEPAATAAPTEKPTETEPRTVRLMTHDSFDISEDVLDAFESEHNARVEILKV